MWRLQVTRLIPALLIILASLSPPSLTLSVCPSKTSILPCTCVQSTIRDISLTCAGESITQTSIDDLFSAIQSSNNKTLLPTDKTVHHLTITGTNLKTLDLAPFISWSFQQFYIYRNPWLTTLKGPSMNNSEGISASDVQTDTNRLNDDSVSTLLHLLIPESVKELVLRENKLTGITGQGTPLTFTSFSRMRKLDLAYNHLKKLEGGQFQGMIKLEKLHLDGNEIGRLGKDALRFDEPEQFEDGLLIIYLDFNKLSDEGIDEQSGLEDIKKHVKMYLRKNYFKFISQGKFEKFLLSSKDRVVKFWGNSFVCSQEKLGWLRKVKRGGGLKGSVYGIDCEDDEGKDVFNTNKIS